MADAPPIDGLYGPPGVWEVQNWSKTLNGLDPHIINNSFIKTVAHVKSLINKWWHEYVYILIHLHDGRRTVIVAERQVAQDQVLLPDWKASTGQLAYHPAAQMALPLQTWVFEDRAFCLVDLPPFLMAIHAERPKYFVAGYSCYWFMRALIVKFEKKCRSHYLKKRWAYGSWMSRWWPWTTKGMYKSVKEFVEKWFPEMFGIERGGDYQMSLECAAETGTKEIEEYLKDAKVEWPNEEIFELERPQEVEEVPDDDKQELNQFKEALQTALSNAKSEVAEETPQMKDLREHLGA